MYNVDLSGYENKKGKLAKQLQFCLKKLKFRGNPVS